MPTGRNSRGTAFTDRPVFTTTADTTFPVAEASTVGFAPVFQNTVGGNWAVDAPLAVPDMDALLRRMREEVPEVELGRPLHRERKISDEEKFTNMIYGMLSNGDPVSNDDMKKYLAITKKKRHIGRQERQYVHHPKDEDGKTTASISCDDIMP